MDELQSDSKLKKICDVLRDKTLQPAEKEAEEILAKALLEAEEIVLTAKNRAHDILESAKKEVSSKLEEGKASLRQSGKRVLDFLKQTVEERFFKASLVRVLEAIGSMPDVAARLIEVLISAVEKEGITGNLTAFISANLSPRKVNELIGKEFLDKLDSEGVVLGNFLGGVRLKVQERDVILDLSAESLKHLLVRFLQKDFRDMVFESDSLNWDI
ncbi:MAG: hypothetical protein RSB82_03310 [Victivallaceae bacterium]